MYIIEYHKRVTIITKIVITLIIEIAHCLKCEAVGAFHVIYIS